MPHIYKDTTNDEILWRLARAACEFGKEEGGDKKKAMTYEAYEYIQRALQLNDKNFAIHKVKLNNSKLVFETKYKIATRKLCACW